MRREDVYVAMTPGREANSAYVPTLAHRAALRRRRHRDGTQQACQNDSCFLDLAHAHPRRQSGELAGAVDAGHSGQTRSSRQDIIALLKSVYTPNAFVEAGGCQLSDYVARFLGSLDCSTGT